MKKVEDLESGNTVEIDSISNGKGFFLAMMRFRHHARIKNEDLIEVYPGASLVFIKRNDPTVSDDFIFHIKGFSKSLSSGAEIWISEMDLKACELRDIQ